jgi:hypothetical protein
VVETEDGEPIGAFAWRPLGFIIGAERHLRHPARGLPKFGIRPWG